MSGKQGLAEAEPVPCCRQVMEKEGPQPAESEESSIYSPAIPREKWQRKRTQVKIRVCGQREATWGILGCVGSGTIPLPSSVPVVPQELPQELLNTSCACRT